MRLSSGLISTTLFTGIALLALPNHLFSQKSVSSRQQIAATELPETPQPQLVLAADSPSSPQVQSTQQPAQSPDAQSSSSAQAPTRPPGTDISQHDIAESQQGSISGTVIATDDEIIPGATIVIESSAPEDRRTVKADENGAFQFDGLKPGVPYHITISANGLITWTSSEIILSPGQHLFLTGSRLKIAGGVTSVTVFSSPEQIAIEQIKVEETQRVFGIIPNFYVVYDPNPVPLTAKLKFKLALRAATDPVTFLGVAFFAGIDQAADTPDFVQGAKGYGQRFGADYTDGFTDIFIGGAILPTLLHQDPRYFYQGTGTKKSRALHALESPFICKGDNGRMEPNFSSVGGDLASGAISNAYYPATNRGPNLVFENALITSGARVVDSLVQEFVLRRFTPKAKNLK